MDEAGEKGVCLIVAEGVLVGPGSVVVGKTEEVVVPQVYTCADEVQQEWVAFVESQYI